MGTIALGIVLIVAGVLAWIMATNNSWTQALGSLAGKAA